MAESGSFENNGNLFTFKWRIKNLQICSKRKNEFINSPAFLIKNFLNTLWFLRLYPKGQITGVEGYPSCYLYLSDCEGLDGLEIYYNIFSVESFVSEKDLRKPTYFNTFTKGKGIGLTSFKTKLGFPENDTFIICSMLMKNAIHSGMVKSLIPSICDQNSKTQKVTNEIFASIRDDVQELQNKFCLFPNQCFAQSLFPMERRSFSLPVDCIPIGILEKRSNLIMTSARSPTLLITLSFCKNSEIENIQIDIHAFEVDSKPVFSICKMSVSDFSGQIRHSISSEHTFTSDNLDDVWHFEIPCAIESEEEPSKNRVRLYCEIMFSAGDMISMIENVVFDDPCHNDMVARTKPVETTSSFQSEMSDLYISKRFCDVTLQLRGKTFQAHKAVLCARSPVFSAMFQNDMEENKTNIIVINDIDADTIDRMLKFMYSDSLDDMHFEVALKLYEAADKYQILTLQEQCGNSVKSNTTVENACAALRLGDKHNDESLKTHVLDFIFVHAREVFASEEWKLFVKQNIQLANEILQEVCMKLLRIQIM